VAVKCAAIAAAPDHHSLPVFVEAIADLGMIVGAGGKAMGVLKVKYDRVIVVSHDAVVVEIDGLVIAVLAVGSRAFFRIF
jgi:hypothetical protein